MLQRITHYIDGRLYEWSFATALLGLAVEILMWPETMSRSAFKWLVADYIRSDLLGIIVLSLGLIRVAALAANGASLVVGPVLRSVCAVISATLWGQFASALIKLSSVQVTPSPGVSFWVVFTLAELYVAYRAMLDFRRVQHVNSSRAH